MSQNSVLVAEAKKELLQLEQRAAALRTLILAYDDTPPAVPIAAVGDSKASAGIGGKKRGRAPVGHFRAVALKLFDGGAELTAAKVRATLQGAGYKYALTSNHVSRQLAEMIESGELTSKPNGAYTTYRKARGKKNA